jgi:hypothetical protein
MMNNPSEPAASNFAEARAQLQEALKKTEADRLALLLAREKNKKIIAELGRRERSFQEENEAHQARRSQLQEQRTQTETAAKDIEAAYALTKKAVLDKLQDFAAYTDPRQGVTYLSDDYPFLLFPVRLETRFKKWGEGDEARFQLWVRIYPDDLAVDTFEPVLSEGRMQNARKYWTDLWRAGGDEGRERAAWRSLAGSHGSDRAAWTIQQYKPLNLKEKPQKANPDDVILVIVTEVPLLESEKEPVEDYWISVWLADGNKSQEDKALAKLKDLLGPKRAAEICASYRPVNMNEAPAKHKKKTEVGVSVAYVVFPQSDKLETMRDSWTQAARVNVMPDRFLLLGYVVGDLVLERLGNPIPSPLVLGPDPSAPEGEQLRQEDGAVVVGEDLKWLVDFDCAVAAGMGFKVDLSEEEYGRGFDRLLVLGVRLSADALEGKALLENLIYHHQYSGKGFSLVPQGTPTNNTEQAGAGFSHTDDPEAGHADYFGQEPLFPETPDWLTKKDGQWLAECLGIDAQTLKYVRHRDGTDQCEARAMNTALWPATLGYFMDTMMVPVFSEQTIEQTRWFFTHFVSGRGMIPAVRIGQQPYGILPTTVFSNMGWLSAESWRPVEGLIHPEGYRAYLRRLYELLKLKKVEVDWQGLLGQVSYVGRFNDPDNPVDPHQLLLDVIGLHPGSVEFYQRYAKSLEEIHNLLLLVGGDALRPGKEVAAEYMARGKQLLLDLGYEGEEMPEILSKLFLDSQQPQRGPLIDDPPVSETEKIRPCTPEPENNNYIQWLIDAAGKSLDTLRQQQGFIDNRPPVTLLYMLLRHALMLGYWDASLRLYQAAHVLTGEALLQARQEPKFIHISGQETSESRFHYLYQAEPSITHQADLLIGDYIPQVLGQIPETRYLHSQIEALQQLKDAPTAHLERVLAEHIDCVSYRLDAWKLGLINYRLAAMRFQGQPEEETRKGIYLGMYGWLEMVFPKHKELTEPELSPEMATIFARNEDPPLMRDNKNAGYIQAPSLNQAVTAAVLRNGYQVNANPYTPQTFAVNLSSERVRRALGMLEGIRNGQSLAALLGYQFERGLHDNHNLAEVDKFIYKLRKFFPLVAHRFKTTRTAENEPIEAVEARNVLNGLELVNYIKRTGQDTYPFGLDLPPASQKQGQDEAAAINLEVQRLLDTHDAVSDLVIAEGVHQAVQGNYDRAAGNLDAYSKGGYPPLPDVVQTPRSGISLTHRVALHFEAGLPHDFNPIGGMTVTPRSQAEPALNSWLAGVLPDPNEVGCWVSFVRAADGVTDKQPVTQAQLGLQPIDLLYLLNPESQQALTAMDDLVVWYAVQHFAPRPDTPVTIIYTERLDHKISFFELAALMRSLRALLLTSRALRPGDFVLPEEASVEAEKALFLDPQRISAPRDDLSALKASLETFQADLETLLTDLTANKDAIINSVDATIDQFTGLLRPVAAFGFPEAGFGFVNPWKGRAFSRLLGKVANLVDRWEQRLDQFDTLMAEYAALPPIATDEERFLILQRAENQVSTKLTSPLPVSPADLEHTVIIRRNEFLAKFGQFEAILQIKTTLLADLFAAVAAVLPVEAFDLTGLDLNDDEKDVLRFVQDLATRAKNIVGTLDKVLKEVDDRLADADVVSDPEAQVQALLEAKKAMFGEDFQMVPEFEISDEQKDEWEKAWNASPDLLDYSVQNREIDFPVDDWLYGIARVRAKMHHWENLTFLVRAFGKSEPELRPLQFPHQDQAYWLALSFPDDHAVEGSRLLYTVHAPIPFTKVGRQCGLLLDEWSEIIPSRDETTGIAFHYDRPNSEPPQAMLLAVPPDEIGHWRWQDLVDTLHETLDMAKRRAIEPEQIDDLAYACFLPATIMAVTLYPITIALNLAMNNQFLQILREDEDG